MAGHDLSSAFPHALRRLFRDTRDRLRPAGPPRRVRPRLEALEDRVTPATFATTTFADGVTGGGTVATLRDAVLAANQDAGTDTDTIQLSAGTYTLSIINVGNSHDTFGKQGDLNISSTAHALVIQGATDANGHPTTIIEQTVADRVFEIGIPGGLGSPAPVTFEDVIIEGGNAQDDGSTGAVAGKSTAEGGGILDVGGDVTLTDVVLQNNAADAGTGVGALGGGIYAGMGGSLTIRSSVVRANGAFGGAVGASETDGNPAAGGGIYAICPTTITDSKLKDNLVTGGSTADSAGHGGGASGGGIFAAGTTTISDSDVSGNTLKGGGGVLGGYASGGGVCVDTRAAAALTASALSGNTLTGGNSNLSSGITFSGSPGDASGGGVYVGIQAAATITASTLSGNTLKGGDSSINNSSASISESLGGAASGGGVYGNFESTLTISTSLLSDNRLTGGNGNFVSGQVDGNIGGDASGGGVYASFGKAVITASTLSGNTVTGGNASGGSATPGTAQGGGASFAGGTSSGYELVNSTVADNQAVGGLSASAGSAAANGGGLFFGSDASGHEATATLTNVTVAGNKASLPQGGEAIGGGIDNFGGSVTLVNTLVALNSATDGPDYAGIAGAGSSHNLIGIADGSSLGFAAAHGDLLGTTANPLDPHLGPLQDNSGPTPTLALLPGSPALDEGDNGAQSVTGPSDQRGQGFARVVNGAIDIGAFEAQPTPPGGSSPAPKPPPALHTPALLALLDALLHGVEAVNGNDTETVTDSLFGIPLLVSTYDGSGDLTSVTLFGINVTSLFELPV